MKIGAMNHPQRDVVGEIRLIAEMGLDFIDLTLEPPAAASWQIDVRRTRQALADTGLAIIGHTAYYLPLGHCFEKVRAGAVEEFCRCAEIFAELGATAMNIHPDFHAPMHDRAFSVRQNVKSLAEIQEKTRRYAIKIMVENIPGSFNNAAQVGDLLYALPELGLHLDLGHTNLASPVNTTDELLAAFGHRLSHVHLHDNKGGNADLHLPLGAGNIDLRHCVQALKDAGYDHTITLEVFTADPEYTRYSAQKLRRIWEGE